MSSLQSAATTLSCDILSVVTSPQHFSWSEVDPAAHPYDPEIVRAITRRVVAGRPPAPRFDGTSQSVPDWTRAHEDAIDRELILHYGPWIGGWRWSIDGKALQRTYPAAVTDPPRGVERVVEETSRWRRWLEELASTFGQLRLANAALEPAVQAERAAVRLVESIVAQTGAEDAWYAAAEMVLGWYLEPVLPIRRAREAAVAAVTSGRFQSWSGPSADELSLAARAYGQATARALSTTAAPIDALAAWRVARESAVWPQRRWLPMAELVRDGHLEFVDRHDGAREPERATRMRAAITAARADAEARRSLDLARLAAWQAIILGAPAALRTTDAFSRAGTERYGRPADLEALLGRCLAEATSADLPTAARAARAYLDVLYLHPFPDGNARAARVVLDYVLWRDRQVLGLVDPIFAVARSALDPGGPAQLVIAIEHLAGHRPTR